MHLRQRNLPRDVRVLPPKWRLLDLVRDLLEPRPVRLNVACHGRELVCDDLVGDERLAEGVAGGGVGEGVGETGARFAVAGDGHDEALFVEVLHDDGEAGVFGADEVRDGDVDVVELDEAGAAGFLAAVGDAAVGEALGGGWDDEHGDAGCAGAAGADGGCHVGCPGHAGYPFFVPVDDVVRAVLALHGCRLDVGDVGLVRISDILDLEYTHVHHRSAQ